VKVETFFEKFDRIVDAPNVVEKMRELVLDLAIQGRLVERRPSDGDGHALLKRLRTLPPERNSKSRSPKDITVEPETPLEVPNHWALTTVENTTRETGFFCDGDWVESKDQDPDGDVRLIQLADVGDGQYRDRSSRFMTNEAAKRLNCSYLQAGDILVARMPDPLGRCCRFPGDSKPAVTVVDVCILRSNITFFDPDFLVVAINCPPFRRLVSAQATGTTRSRISRSNLGVLPIPLPPLDEQKRIAAKVEELMAICGRLEVQQQERETRHAALARASLARFADAPTLANLNFLFHPAYTIPAADLRKSILTLAVQGKLVPQDPSDGNAREVIDRAMEKRRRTIKMKSLRRKDLDESVDLFGREDLPSSWCVERFANLVDPENTISYGVLVPGDDVADGIPFVRAQDLCLSNHPSRPNKSIAPEVEKPYARTRLTGGEILLCVVGSIGKLGTAPDHWAGANIARAVARIKPIPEVLRDYLLLVLQEQSVQNYFTSTTRTLAQPTLNVGTIEQTPIPVPPFAEQRRIATKVDQLIALVNQLETQLVVSRAMAAHLLEAVVAELTSAQVRADSLIEAVENIR
jgi:type I restriction enzyme, S subunit